VHRSTFRLGNRALRVALIATDYPPQRTSAAIQIKDLAQELLRQGHQPVVIVPKVGLPAAWTTEVVDGVEVLSLAGLATKDISYLRRTVSEFLLSFMMMRALRKSPHRYTSWDIVAWYSPTIFFGLFVRSLKRASKCKTYLILRDIFPEWAHDLGLIRKGPSYAFLKAAANLQYSIADTIGVQTYSNLTYVSRWAKPTRRIEVLQNWQAMATDFGSSITVSHTPLAGRKVFVYIGNMGVAQGMDIFLELAERLKHRQDLGFLFVGRGSEVTRLSGAALDRGLTNTLFFNEVDSREMPGLLAQCHVGLLALDPRHKTHNIPGKFLTYLLAGLPVLARVNAGTDLAYLIENEDVGRVYVGNHVDPLSQHAEELADWPLTRDRMATKGRALGARMFSPETAVRQIIAASGLGVSPLNCG
jgi:glycosyltransferase involved in cell wall biosynthesis